MRRWVLLSVFLVLGAAHSSAQEKVAQHGYLWQRYYFKGVLTERFSLHVEAERRTFETTRYTSQSLFPRIHLHYHFKNEMHVGFGVAHFMNYAIQEKENRNPLARSEVRLHQELNFHQPFGRFKVSHRYMIEERLYMPFDNEELVREPQPFEYGFRFRYQLLLHTRLTPVEKCTQVYFKFYDELLLQASEANPHRLFEANRFYAAIEVRFTDVWALEAGYLTWIQLLNKRYAEYYLVPHIARITLHHTINFSKKHS